MIKISQCFYTKHLDESIVSFYSNIINNGGAK